MTAELIDGKQIASEIRAEVAASALELTERGTRPGVAAGLVGDVFPNVRIGGTGELTICEKDVVIDLAFRLQRFDARNLLCDNAGLIPMELIVGATRNRVTRMLSLYDELAGRRCARGREPLRGPVETTVAPTVASLRENDHPCPQF